LLSTATVATEIKRQNYMNRKVFSIGVRVWLNARAGPAHDGNWPTDWPTDRLGRVNPDNSARPDRSTAMRTRVTASAGPPGAGCCRCMPLWPPRSPGPRPARWTDGRTKISFLDQVIKDYRTSSDSAGINHAASRCHNVDAISPAIWLVSGAGWTTCMRSVASSPQMTAVHFGPATDRMRTTALILTLFCAGDIMFNFELPSEQLEERKKNFMKIFIHHKW